MMLMPCGPSAVPTGGAGVACPAGIWILTIAANFFFAISILLCFVSLSAICAVFLGPCGAATAHCAVLAFGSLVFVRRDRPLTTRVQRACVLLWLFTASRPGR